MFDVIIVIAGVSCGKTKIGGWGFSAYHIKDQKKYRMVNDPRLKEKLIGGYYLSSLGVNRKWTLADDNEEHFTVLEVADLHEVAGAVPTPSTLALAESHGFLEAMKLVNDMGWKRVLVCCESRYVASNLEKLIKVIHSNAPPKNHKQSDHSLWDELTQIILKLNSEKVNIKWQWINDFLPRVMAEYSKLLAKKGQALSYNRKDKIEEIYPFGKKKVPENKSHGLLSQARMYFIPNQMPYVTADNKHYYLCGNHGTNENWCGKPKSDSTISVVVLDEVDPVIDLVTKIKKEYSGNDIGQIIRLDNLKTAAVRNEIISHHKDLTLHDPDSGNLYDYAGRVLVFERNPPMLFFKLHNQLIDLYHKLSEITTIEYSDNIFKIDITDKIFDKTARGAKVISSTFKQHKYVDIMVEALNKQVTLTLGIELPSDLGLRRIAPENPIVQLVIEKVGPLLYKYYLYIKSNKAEGLFTTTDANSIFIEPKKH